jgi:hypothetical protein
MGSGAQIRGRDQLSKYPGAKAYAKVGSKEAYLLAGVEALRVIASGSTDHDSRAPGSASWLGCSRSQMGPEASERPTGAIITAGDKRCAGWLSGDEQPKP